MGCVNQGSVAVTEKKYKFVIVGLEGSGKTAIYEQLRQGKFVQTTPTQSVNMDFDRKDFLLFDLGGKVPKLWSNYYDNMDGLVFVIDSTNKNQLFEVKEHILQLNKHLEYSNAVILILFTKQDLRTTLDNRFLIEESGIYQHLDLDIIVQMCSAKTGDGVKEGFAKLLSFLRKQSRMSIAKK